MAFCLINTDFFLLSETAKALSGIPCFPSLVVVYVLQEGRHVHRAGPYDKFQIGPSFCVSNCCV